MDEKLMASDCKDADIPLDADFLAVEARDAVDAALVDPELEGADVADVVLVGDVAEGAAIVAVAVDAAAAVGVAFDGAVAEHVYPELDDEAEVAVAVAADEDEFADSMGA